MRAGQPGKQPCTFLIKIVDYISPTYPEALHGQTFTKLCAYVEIVDIITRGNYFGDRLRDVDSVGNRK